MKKAMYRWQYETAAQYAKAVRTLNQKMAETSSFDIVLPAIMCQVLAIEFLIKSLILYKRDDVVTEEDLKKSGIRIRGHNLQSLFRLLHPDIISSLEKHFVECRTERMKTMKFTDLLLEIGEEPFVDWRYFYEKTSWMQMNKDALDILLESIGKTANDYL